MAMSQFWGITFYPSLNECASSMFNSKKIRKYDMQIWRNEIGSEIDSTETNRKVFKDYLRAELNPKGSR